MTERWILRSLGGGEEREEERLYLRSKTQVEEEVVVEWHWMRKGEA